MSRQSLPQSVQPIEAQRKAAGYQVWFWSSCNAIPAFSDSIVQLRIGKPQALVCSLIFLLQPDLNIPVKSFAPAFRVVVPIMISLILNMTKGLMYFLVIQANPL
jgi:hypothetical protein